MNHYEFLSHLHEALRPAVYLETGVERGHTLALAKEVAIGIDPAPVLEVALSAKASVFEQTSDDFFQTRDFLALTDGALIDFAFIDGLHLFDAALRDFINIERFSHPGTIVCIHDVVPHSIKMASRTPQADGWTGDVYGVILALRQHRPELLTAVLDVSPTGMLVVGNLDSRNEKLSNGFDAIFSQHLAIDYSKIHESRNEIFSVIPPTMVFVDFLAKRNKVFEALRGWRDLKHIVGSDSRVRLGSGIA